jgi:hypothetical protein
MQHASFEAFAQMRFASQRNEGQKQHAFSNQCCNIVFGQAEAASPFSSPEAQRQRRGKRRGQND